MDKGSATVVVPQATAILATTELMRQLNNQHHYEKLPRDATELFLRETKASLQHMVICYCIDKKQWQVLS